MVENKDNNKVVGFMTLPDNASCQNCGSYSNLMCLVNKNIIKGLPVEEQRIACRVCYDFSVEHGRLPTRSEL